MCFWYFVSTLLQYFLEKEVAGGGRIVDAQVGSHEHIFTALQLHKIMGAI